MKPKVVIDYLPESVRHYREGYAIVAVDVIRATTTAISSVAGGWRCFPVSSLEHALPLAARLQHPLLVGELGGNMPYGFDVTNSPAKLAQRPDNSRPIILLSSSGTRLICDAESADAVYLACFRNVMATAKFILGRHNRVAVIGAGTRGEFREEDQMCCAMVAAELIACGFESEDTNTTEIIRRWQNADPDAWLDSKSVNYLRDSDQVDDLEFVLRHRDDIDAVFMMKHDEVTLVSADGGHLDIRE
jgi:2-phosphosulfolactate phosphatase